MQRDLWKGEEPTCMEQTQGFVPFMACRSQFCCEKVTDESELLLQLGREFLLPKLWAFGQGCCVPREDGWYLWDK